MHVDNLHIMGIINKGDKIMNKIQELRKEMNITMRQASQIIGIPYTTYVSYEKGDREPNSEMLVKIASSFNVTVDYLLGRSDVKKSNYQSFNPMPETLRKPRLGRVACGDPIFAEENIEGYDDVPDFVKCDFTLKCEGDSMIGARIFDGDIVYVKTQETVENGQIAVVRIGEESTLKRFYQKGNTVTLMPENPKYEPLVFVDAELNNIRILGKAVAFTSSIK